MAKICFLLEDRNLQREFENLISEYMKVTQAADLEAVFLPDIPSVTTVLKEQPPVEEGKNPEVRIVYFQISQQRKNWIKLIPQLKQFGPKTSFVILKFDDDGIGKLDLLDSTFDDLIYLPLDRSIFLQKMQILMALPKKASPSFLFHIEKEMPIEVSKLSHLNRFNDCIWWMDNPIPLQKDLPSHFYLTIPTLNTTISTHAKVLLSQPHHEKKDLFQVAFALMGPHREELTQMRIQMQQTFKTHLLIREDQAGMMQPLHVGIAEADQNVRERVQELLERELPGCKVSTESSLTLLTQAGSAAIDWSTVSGTANADFPSMPFEFLIHKDTKDFKAFKADISKDHLWLGYGLEDWRGGPQKWWAAFDTPENKALVEEALMMVKGPGNPHWVRALLVKDSAGGLRQINLELHMDKDDQVLVKILPQEHVLKPKQERSNEPFDLIIVSSKFVPENGASWLEGQHTLTKCPRFFILIEQNEHVDPAWLSSPHLKGVSIKPIDPRHLMVLVTESVGRKDLKYSMDNLGFAKTNWYVHAAKPVKLVSVAEYGVTLELTRPLRNGTFLFLRGGIFDKAPNKCLCARSYISEEREKNKYHVSFTYYGIQEDFLKHVRHLVMELYALEKSQEGAS